MNVEFRAGAAEGLHQNRLRLLAQLGRVVFARCIDQARQEALEAIPPDEQPETLPLSQMQDPYRRAQQLILANLEQLVARIGLENVDQRLAGMAARRKLRARQDVGGLAPQQRDIRRARAIRSRREQPQETVFAAHLAFGVEALD